MTVLLGRKSKFISFALQIGGTLKHRVYASRPSSHATLHKSVYAPKSFWMYRNPTRSEFQGATLSKLVLHETNHFATIK